MEMRDDSELKSLRPEVFIEKTSVSEIEAFQNSVLRPILKYQHTLFTQLTKSHDLFQKQISRSHTIQEKRTAIKQFFITQVNFKYFIIGQICGLMTNDEFDFYIKNKKDLDKRLTGMLTERILSNEV
jgi:hypothetical protein